MRVDLLPSAIVQSGYEVYDHSALDVIRGCDRRAIVEQIGPRGIPLRGVIGDGGDFGTVLHYGTNVYYSNLEAIPDYRKRRNHALYEANAFYQTIFSDERLIDRKHTRENAIINLYHYFEQNQAHDKFYRLIKPEMGLGILMKWEPGDPPAHKDFEPWWYVGRVDRLLERISTHEYLVDELKTFSTGTVELRLKLLKLNRQPIGYTYLVKEWLSRVHNQQRNYTFMGDVIYVSATMLSTARDTFEVGEQRFHDWRFQTIRIVEQWRMKRTEFLEARARGDEETWNYANMDTSHCYDFMSICPFYETICEHGPMSPGSVGLAEDNWNPFYTLGEKDIAVFE